VPSEQTRRTFLKLSAVGVTAAAAGELATATPATASGPQSSEISVRVTNGTQRYAAAESLAWRKADKTVDNVILLDPGIKFQEMLGFGAAFTDAACYTFSRLDPSAREQLFHEMFHPSEMGLNVCRTCIGASDYSREVFSYDEGDPDPEMTRFSIAHDQAYVLPMLREARKANPDLFLFSSPWSPPGWMKAGGSMLGGSMRQRYFGPYAQYFLKFLQSYAAEGVPVQAVTVQNEVDTDQDGRMPACSWPQEYEIGFVKNHLGPVLQKNGLNTKIWILDHNYNLWGRAVAELDDPDLRKFCNAIAFHGYVGTPEMMTKAHEAYPDAQMYWTEGGPDYTAADYATDWANGGEDIHPSHSQLVPGDHRMESRSRREGTSEYWAIPVRRHGHYPFPNERDLTQWTILGIRALLPQRPKGSEAFSIRMSFVRHRSSGIRESRWPKSLGCDQFG
jgi:glucosylceramidase